MKTHRLIISILLLAVLITGCGKKPEPILFYCGEPFIEPVGELLPRFYDASGLHVSVYGINHPLELHTQTKANAEAEESESAPESAEPSERSSGSARGIPRSAYTPDPTGIAPDIRAEMRRLAELGHGDLWLNDSPIQREYWKAGGNLAAETPICFLVPVLLCSFPSQKSTPSDADSPGTAILDELATRQKILGVLCVDRSGLGEVSDTIITHWENRRKAAETTTAAADTLDIRVYPTQEDLFTALEQGEVDAIIVWNASARERERSRNAAARRNTEDRREDNETINQRTFEIREFSGENRIVVPVCLVSLSSTLNYVAPPKLVGFLKSRVARETFKKHGFQTE